MPIFRSTRLYIAAYGFQHLMLLAGALDSRFAGSVGCYSTESSSILHTVHTTRVPALQGSSNIKCWKPYAAIYSLVLLKMGVVVPETCWVNVLLIKKLIIFASSWSYSSIHIKDARSYEHQICSRSPKVLKSLWTPDWRNILLMP